MIQKLKNILKSKVFIVTFIFLAAVSIFVYANIPKDIGSKLHYTGREDYGCMPFPFLVCFSPQGSSYYYTTKLSQDELKSYFTKATPLSEKTEKYSSYNILYYKINDSQEEFLIFFYKDKQDALKSADLGNDNLPYVISVDSSYYDLARSAL